MGAPDFCGRVRLDCPAPPDRELHGGGQLPGVGTSVHVLAATNPVWDRVSFSLGDGQDSALAVPARNHCVRTGPAVCLLRRSGKQAGEDQGLAGQARAAGT